MANPTMAGRFVPRLLACGFLVPLCFIATTAWTVVRLIRELPVYRAAARVDVPAAGGAESVTHFAALAELPAVTAQAQQDLNRPREEIARKLQRMAALPRPEAAQLELRVDALDPVFAADLANAWAEVFLAEQARAGLTGLVVAARALPAAQPLGPRKLRQLFVAGATGVAGGLLLAVASAWLLTVLGGRGGGGERHV